MAHFWEKALGSTSAPSERIVGKKWAENQTKLLPAYYPAKTAAI